MSCGKSPVCVGGGELTKVFSIEIQTGRGFRFDLIQIPVQLSLQSFARGMPILLP